MLIPSDRTSIYHRLIVQSLARGFHRLQLYFKVDAENCRWLDLPQTTRERGRLSLQISAIIPVLRQRLFDELASVVQRLSAVSGQKPSRGGRATNASSKSSRQA